MRRIQAGMSALVRAGSKPGGPMSLDQNAQLLGWLDEEHRKDKAMIADLTLQLDQHLTQINGLSRSIQDLEERLARVQSQSLRYSQIEQALNQVKTEVTLLFEQFNERMQQREDESFKIRQKERERLDKAIADLSNSIQEVSGQWRPYAPDHEALKRVENGQIPLMRGLEDLGKRQEAVNSRLSVTEEWVKRTGALIAEIQQLSERLRQDRADALEVQRRADQMRARQVTEWSEQMKVARREMEEWVSKLVPMLDLPKEVRGSLSGLKELERDLKQIEPRLAQRQKITEETSLTAIRAMREELEKSIATQTKEWEFWKDEWSKKLFASSSRIDPIEEWRPIVADQFREIREQMQVDRQRWLDILSDVVRMEIEWQRSENLRYDQMASDVIKRVETAQAGARVKRPAPPKPPEP